MVCYETLYELCKALSPSNGRTRAVHFRPTGFISYMTNS